jgi:chromosome segregation ATPase
VHLREWSEEAERRGEIEKAKHLWRESEEIAGAIEREVEEHEGRREAEDDELEEMEREIRHLRELAEREKAEGRHEKAEAIMGEAEELKERLIGSIEERERDDDLEEYVEEFEEAFEALRDEVNELREIVEELREKLSNR